VGREFRLFSRLSILAEVGIGCNYGMHDVDDKFAAFAATGIGFIIEPKKMPAK
jgi:hypothetical protein